MLAALAACLAVVRSSENAMTKANAMDSDAGSGSVWESGDGSVHPTSPANSDAQNQAYRSTRAAPDDITWDIAAVQDATILDDINSCYVVIWLGPDSDFCFDSAVYRIDPNW
jgi:hypothetical protein